MSQKRRKLLKRLPLLLIPVALLAVMATLSPSPKVAVAQQPPPPNCVDDLTGVSNNCSAGDVTLAILYNVAQVSCVPGEMVTLDLRAEVVAGANERWDIGIFIALDGGDAFTGNCYHDFLTPPLAPEGTCSVALTPCVDDADCPGGETCVGAAKCSVSGTTCNKDADCPAGETCTNGYVPGWGFPLADGGPFYNGEWMVDPLDQCGDLEQGINNYHDLNPGVGLTVPCIDTNGDGRLDIGTVVSWDNTRNNTCVDIGDAVPNTRAKCYSERMEVANVFVPKYVEVVKALVPTDDPGLFDLQIDGFTWFPDATHGDTTGPQEVMTPTATVAELAGTGTSLADYSSSILCYDQVGRCEGDPTIHCTNDVVCGVFQAGICEYPNTVVGSCDPCTFLPLDIPDLETNILCTITNTRQIQPGSITIVKNTDPPDAPPIFDFTSSTPPLAFSLGDGDSQPFLDLLPEIYSFVETVPPGWDLDRVECIGQQQSNIIPIPDGVDVELAEGEDIVCTFYNIEQTGTIIVEKQTIPPGSPQLFDFTPDYGPPFQLSDGQTDNSGPVPPGIYSVSETEPPGWTLILATCDDGSDPSAIDLQPGETVTCLFENIADPGTIIVEKQTIPPGSPQLFDFTPDYGPPFQLSDGQTDNSGPLPPGIYSVSETEPPGWTLTSATCDDGSNPSAIDLQAGETVTCIFENAQQEGNIIVEKQTIPDGSPQLFDFTTSYGAPFQLSDGQTDNSGPLAPGTYSVSETEPPGWTLTSAVCSDGSPINAISLQDGETVTCVFTNTQQEGNIIVEKQTVPDGSPQSFTFTPSYGAQFQLTDGQTDNSGPLPPGTYSVSETEPPGWTLTSAVCSDGSPINAISLQDGETVTCVFTNTQQAGNIIVEKQTVPDGSPQSFTFTPSYGAQFQLTDGQTNNSGPLQPGIYSVAETVPAGWTLTSAVCSDGSPINAISLQDAETVTCVFTNTQQAGNIIVEKQTIPGGSPQLFTFTPSYGSAFQLSDNQTNNSGPLAPGTYSVAETVPAGWTLTSAVCSDGSPVGAISLQDAETVTCVFTNTQQAGNIIVQKQTVPDGSPQSFTFTPSYGAQFQLSDGQTSNSGPLQAGIYSVSEINIPPGWSLTSAVCSDQSPSGAIDLQAGETVVCVFTNTQQLQAASVTACKQHDQDGNLGTSGDRVPVVNWPVYLWTDGVRGPEERTVSGGCYTWTGLTPGPTYAVQEHVYSGWTALTGTFHGFGPSVSGGLYSYTFINTEEEPPPFVPEASTLLLLGSAVSGLAGYAGLQVRSRRRKQ